MANALISLGANLGDRAAALEAAAAALDEQPQVRIAARSAWKETAPVGGPEGQPPFLNGAVLVETTLTPRALLAALQAIEARLGRRRETHWGARTIDLDFLLYDEAVLDEPGLTLPHPRMAFRRFVLEPAAEAAPRLVHPQIGWTVAQLLEHLNAAPNYVALTGLPGTGKTRLAQRAAASAGALFCGDPAGSPDAGASFKDGSALDEEIGHSHRRIARIQESLAQSPGGVVSDFWVDQSLAHAEARGGASLGGARYSELQAIAKSAPSPKLVVLLDRKAASPETASAERREATGQTETLAEVLHSLATRRGRGPFLVLDPADFDRAAEEVAAATMAMR